MGSNQPPWHSGPGPPYGPGYYPAPPPLQGPVNQQQWYVGPYGQPLVGQPPVPGPLYGPGLPPAPAGYYPGYAPQPWVQNVPLYGGPLMGMQQGEYSQPYSEEYGRHEELSENDAASDGKQVKGNSTAKGTSKEETKTQEKKEDKTYADAASFPELGGIEYVVEFPLQQSTADRIKDEPVRKKLVAQMQVRKKWPYQPGKQYKITPPNGRGFTVNMSKTKGGHCNKCNKDGHVETQCGVPEIRFFQLKEKKPSNPNGGKPPGGNATQAPARTIIDRPVIGYLTQNLLLDNHYRRCCSMLWPAIQQCKTTIAMAQQVVRSSSDRATVQQAQKRSEEVQAKIDRLFLSHAQRCAWKPEQADITDLDEREVDEEDMSKDQYRALAGWEAAEYDHKRSVLCLDSMDDMWETHRQYGLDWSCGPNLCELAKGAQTVSKEPFDAEEYVSLVEPRTKTAAMMQLDHWLIDWQHDPGATVLEPWDAESVNPGLRYVETVEGDEIKILIEKPEVEKDADSNVKAQAMHVSRKGRYDRFASWSEKREKLVQTCHETVAQLCDTIAIGDHKFRNRVLEQFNQWRPQSLKKCLLQLRKTAMKASGEIGSLPGAENALSAQANRLVSNFTFEIKKTAGQMRIEADDEDDKLLRGIDNAIDGAVQRYCDARMDEVQKEGKATETAQADGGADAQPDTDVSQKNSQEQKHAPEEQYRVRLAAIRKPVSELTRLLKPRLSEAWHIPYFMLCDVDHAPDSSADAESSVDELDN